MLDIRTKKAKKGAHAVKKAEKTAAPKAKKKTFRVPLAAKIAGGVLALLLVALCAFTYLYPYVFPGVTVGSISVSGLSRSDAEEKIRREGPTLYEGEDVSVKIYETTYDIPVDDVLQNVDSAQSAENAFSVGRRGSPYSRLWDVGEEAAG